MSDAMHVTSRANPTFQRLRRLGSEPRERSRTGRTLLEGDHLIRAWLERGHAVLTLVIDARVVAAPEDFPDLARIIDSARAGDIDIVAMPADLLRQLSTLDSPSPVVAEIMPIDGDPAALRGQDVVLLDRLQDPGNVGAILRTCAAAGVKHAVAGPGTAALWSPKVLRAAMGAHAVLNLVVVDDLAACCRALQVPVYGTSSHALATIDTLDLRGPGAWVFGHEGQGLDAGVEAAIAAAAGSGAGALVAIDQAPDVESLNVAAAAAVCLFEMRRQRRSAAGAG
jgi:TrmH family RNA methyltransferase